jgi:hypothetical protein
MHIESCAFGGYQIENARDDGWIEHPMFAITF